MTKPPVNFSKVVLFGSTGSIGTQVLDVIRRFPDRFQPIALSAGRNIERFADQVREFNPSRICIQDSHDITKLMALVPDYRGEILAGEAGLLELAAIPEADTAIVGLVGLCGLAPSLKALETGKRLLTANKETFVTGGHLVAPYLDRIVPIDSEHVAIHQCLKNEPHHAVRKIYLTASGGPFRNHTQVQLERVTLQEALKHPNWVMGSKITIDSATLMNKGLEVIEAHWLFGVSYDQIRIVVHPQSIIHSGVEFVDGSILVQMGAPDMHVPIQYAMTWPERLPEDYPNARLDLLSLSRLDLEPPDPERFPCIRLAFEAGRMGSSATAVLNGADEMAVELFLEEKIQYLDIPRLLEKALQTHQKLGISPNPSLAEIHHLDAWARNCVLENADKARIFSPTT